MQRAFAGRVGTIVAADAIVDDIGMVEVGWRPGNGRMAIVAVITTGDVCRVFASCRVAVMARSAGADHLCVVHNIGWHPDVGGMTVLTHVAGLDMGQRLARRVRSVMAAEAIASDIDMIEIRRQPTNG